MKFLPALALVVIILNSAAFSQSEAQKKRFTDEIVAVMNAQSAAWNRGDIEGFMDGYAREDTTTFVSGDAVTRGWQTVLDRYKAAYDSRAKMGTLSFTELEFKPLSPFYIMASGRWQLTREADNPHGRFTLIFRRTAAGWRIVHDHTSSE